MYNNEMMFFWNLFGKSDTDSNFEKWGHFTQMVWKDTKTVGCATYTCPSLANAAAGPEPYTVCNYKPSGMFSRERKEIKSQLKLTLELQAIWVASTQPMFWCRLGTPCSLSERGKCSCSLLRFGSSLIRLLKSLFLFFSRHFLLNAVFAKWYISMPLQRSSLLKSVRYIYFLKLLGSSCINFTAGTGIMIVNALDIIIVQFVLV